MISHAETTEPCEEHELIQKEIDGKTNYYVDSLLNCSTFTFN